ncbi:MAG: M56 family metallopeptidase, partial [Angelakisella sp.]
VHCDDILQSCTERVGLHRKVKIYRSDAFDTPVVMGVFRPRIILPAFMELEERKTLLHIITHELVHIHRHDHVTKVIFTLALIFHWFNPLVWLIYFLFGRDIEASCDEKSLSLLGEEEKTGYATSLVALCTAQRRYMSVATLSFAESNIKERVTCALDYHPLSRWKMVLLSCLVLAVGLVTSTNPVVVAHGYAPVRHSVSKDAESRFVQAVPRLTDALTQGDTRVLMTLCGTTDAYYASLYAPLEKAPIVVTEYKLYPQSDELCYCYLHTEEGGEYTAVFTQRDGNVRLTTLTRGDAFEAAMAVDSSCEQVRFIKNLHRFGITTGFAEPQTLPRPAVAALCIDEEYHDRVKSGEIPPETKYLPPEWIAKAAQDYFGIADF